MEDRPATVSADEIRATAADVAAEVETRVLALLAERGACSTLQLVNGVSAIRGSRRDLVEALAALIERGLIVGTRRPFGRADWLAGVTWRVADV